MKKLFISLIILLSNFVVAQNAQDIIDGLKKDLKTNIDDKKRATIYSDLTWYYSNVSIDSALSYGQKAIVESTKLGDSTLIAQVYSDVGAVYFRKGDFQKSKENYLSAYKIRKIKKDFNGLAKININLASIYSVKQQYKLALKSYFDAIDFFEKNNNLPVANATKANVGFIFFELKDYKKSIKYINEALVYQKNNNQSDKLCTSYLTMGNSYLQLKDTVTAIKFYNKSLKECTETGNKTAISSVLNNLGLIKTAQSKSKDAMLLYNKSLKVREELNSDLDKASLKLNIAKEYTLAKRYKDAQLMLLEIKKIFESKKSNDNLLLTYNQLIPVYAHLNQPDSVIFYSEKYSLLKDQLLNSSVLKQTAELETKYQTAKKEKLILEQDAQNKKKNTWLIMISLLTIFTGAIGFLIYRQQKLKNKQQQQEFQLKSAISQIETQNKLQEQRLTISRDLHDNIGAQLTFVISSVDNLKFGNQVTDSKITNQLTKISDFTKSTIVELRDTIWAMNTNEFTFDDLRSRIFNFIEKAKSAKEDINFKFNVDENVKEVKFSSIIGINLYRTMQEAVNNAVKYADAKEIEVNVSYRKNQTKIEIKDNGNGFDLETVDFGNGLTNMRKRIDEIGGNLIINSIINKGTTISILLSKNQ